MRTLHRAMSVLAGTFALLAALAGSAGAQAPGKPGLLDANMATEAELSPLPQMTPAIAKGLVERRPFKSVVDLIEMRRHMIRPGQNIQQESERSVPAATSRLTTIRTRLRRNGVDVDTFGFQTRERVHHPAGRDWPPPPHQFAG